VTLETGAVGREPSFAFDYLIMINGMSRFGRRDCCHGIPTFVEENAVDED
jgi:hypothetical protein